MSDTKKYTVAGSAIGGLVLFLLVFSTLYANDYREILSSNPNAQVFVLDYVEDNRFDIVGRSNFRDIEWYRQRVEPQFITSYVESDKVLTSEWRVYYGIQQIKYRQDSSQAVTEGSDKVSILSHTDLYTDSHHSNHLGRLTRETEVYPKSYKQTIRWFPQDDKLYNIQWHHQLEKGAIDESFTIYPGSDPKAARLIFDKLEISSKDELDQVKRIEGYSSSDRVVVFYKSARGFQEIDPTVSLGPYTLNYWLVDDQYTPSCLTRCKLTIEWNISKNLGIDSNHFSKALAWEISDSVNVGDIEIGVLEERAFTRYVQSGTESYGNATEYPTYNQVEDSVFEWNYYTIPNLPIDTFIKNTNYRARVRGSIDSGDSADVILEVVGFNLTEFAAWNGTTVELDESNGLLVYYRFNSTHPYEDSSNNSLTLLNTTVHRSTIDDYGIAGEAIEFTGTLSELYNNTHANQVFPDNKMLSVITIAQLGAWQNTMWSLGDSGANTNGIYAKFGAFFAGGNGLAVGRFSDGNYGIEVKDGTYANANYENVYACYYHEWNGTGGNSEDTLTIRVNGTNTGYSNSENAAIMDYSNASFVVGARMGLTEDWVGNMSLLAAYNRRLNQTEIEALCDSFDPFNVSVNAAPIADSVYFNDTTIFFDQDVVCYANFTDTNGDTLNVYGNLTNETHVLYAGGNLSNSSGSLWGFVFHEGNYTWQDNINCTFTADDGTTSTVGTNSTSIIGKRFNGTVQNSTGGSLANYTVIVIDQSTNETISQDLSDVNGNWNITLGEYVYTFVTYEGNDNTSDGDVIPHVRD